MSDSLISQLGIDPSLLLAQIVNFTILLLVLRKFLYKPMLDMFHKRSSTIAKSIREAKKIEEDVKKLEETKENEMRQARVQAKDIVNQAVSLAEKEKEKVLVGTKTESDKMVADAKNIIRTQKDQMLKELEKETGGLAVAMVEKFFKSGVTKEEHERIVKNIVSAI